jgi:hypothetical protein
VVRSCGFLRAREQAILKVVGWEVRTEVGIHVTEDSIVLKRHQPRLGGSSRK